MRRTFTFLLALLTASMLPFMSSAQVFFTEDFEGTMNVTTDLPTNWTESTLSTDGGWNTDNATNATSAYLTWPAPTNGTIFAYTNDDDCNCDKSNDRMFLPVQNFSTYTAVGMTFDLYFNGTNAEEGHVIVSTNGGTSFDTVYTATGNAAAWQDAIAVSLSPYAGQSAVLIGFVYNDIAAWSYGMGIDDISLAQLASPEDLEAISAVSEYTRIPLPEVANMDLGAIVTNNGVTNATDAVITSEVWSSTNGFTTPIFTQASPNSTVNVGDTVLISNGTYTPTAVASYIYRHIISSVAINDGQPLNDTIDYAFDVTQYSYARDDSTVVIGLGVNGTANSALLGNNYTFSANTVIASVQFGMTGILAGDTTAVIIYNTDVTGMPTTPIDSFNHIMVTAGPTIESVSIPGGLNLAPGTYFFGMKEFLSVNNMGLMGMDNIFNEMTCWGSVNFGAFDPIEVIGFRNSFYVRPQLAPPCTNSSSSASVAICDGQSYTIGTSTYMMQGTYTDTLPLPGGCDSVVTTILTVNQLPTVTVTLPATVFCDDDPAVMLMGSPTGGTFSGPGVTGSMFDPSAAGVGMHSITYTYTDTTTSCSASDTTMADVSVCIGISDDMFSQIEISPNPNNGNFKVTGLVSGAQIEIMDLRGKVVLRSIASMNEEIVNIQDQSAGLYFVRITNENESRQYKVIVE